MQFSMGFFDWLFGEKIEIPLPGGRTRTVTRRWFEEMQRKGLITDVTSTRVRVHLLRPLAAAMYDMMGGNPIPTYSLAIWTIGNEVSKEQVEKHRDSTSGDLYAVVMSKLDRSTMKMNIVPELCSREYWNEQAELNDVEAQ